MFVRNRKKTNTRTSSKTPDNDRQLIRRDKDNIPNTIEYGNIMQLLTPMINVFHTLGIVRYQINDVTSGELGQSAPPGVDYLLNEIYRPYNWKVCIL